MSDDIEYIIEEGESTLLCYGPCYNRVMTFVIIFTNVWFHTVYLHHPRILLCKAWILALRKFPQIAQSNFGSYLVLSATESEALAAQSAWMFDGAHVSLRLCPNVYT